jgi:hypothetical protein
MLEKKEKRGGYRQGAGRHKGTVKPDEKKLAVQKAVCITNEELAALQEVCSLTKKSASAFLREAMKEKLEVCQPHTA